MKTKVLMSWSSGKDSAYALYLIRQNKELEVVGLLTTVTEDFDRVSMHGVRQEILEAQAEAIGLPLEIIWIPKECTNSIYEEKMSSAIKKAKAQKITHMAFGDLFLQDIRAYREKNLEGTGITPLFPLWEMPTPELALTMIESGIKAILTCVDTKKLDSSFSGREFDQELLKDLPTDVDPCGERGEFHTFVYDSPLFKSPIEVSRGEKLTKEGFAFTDLKRFRE